MRLWPILVLVIAACGCAGVHGLPPAGTTGSSQAPANKPAVHPPRPHIVWRPIPFGAARRAQTAAYAERHYGIRTWRLRHPHVIVEHYTASQTFASAYATFASDAPDSELHELPGTCAHFVIDRDGTIYQLVPLDTICRHTVGLNWTAIGIEHVGTSDAEILHDRAQMRASLALTAWLAWRFHVQLRNVIGHSESLTSPYHHERVAAWRCQTHSDWQHADMDVYRHLLRRRLRAYGVPLGPPARPVSSGC
ncbi:MAG TPA: peptidoglycan recognition family protein [Gaiellales bacterium]|jgi:beta-N-acetylhexosaminidase|nr:peptidoglycan recognition family protein [Gaiellales bacterium]